MKDAIVASEAFSERLSWAVRHFRLVEGREVTHEEIGASVGLLVGLEPIGPSNVSRWRHGSVPDLATIAAVATVLSVDPGWLAFGEISSAGPPDSYLVPNGQQITRGASG